MALKKSLLEAFNQNQLVGTLWIIAAVCIAVGIFGNIPMYGLGILCFVVALVLLVQEYLQKKQTKSEPKRTRGKVVRAPRTNEPIVTEEETDIILCMALLAQFGSSKVDYYGLGKSWQIDVRIGQDQITLVIPKNGYLGYLDSEDNFHYFSRDNLVWLTGAIKAAADKKKLKGGGKVQNQPQQSGAKTIRLNDVYRLVGQKLNYPVVLDEEAAEFFTVIEQDGKNVIIDSRVA